LFTVSAGGYVPYRYKNGLIFCEILGVRRGEIQVLDLIGCRSASASVGSFINLHFGTTAVAKRP